MNDDLQAVAKQLGITDPTDQDVVQLTAIHEYTKGDLAEVRAMEQRLGSTGIGERRVDKLYRNVKLRRQIGDLHV